MSTTATQQVPAEVLRARTAVAVVFIATGLAFASFISRTPALRDALGLSSAQLGLLLLCMSVGSVLALPASGPVVHRFAPGRSALAAGVVVGLTAETRDQRFIGWLIAVGAACTTGAASWLLWWVRSGRDHQQPR